MGLKAEPRPHPYNMNWVNKTAQSITQRCQVPTTCLAMRIVDEDITPVSSYLFMS